MPIDQDMRKTCAFLASRYKAPGETKVRLHMQGTAFFVGIPIPTTTPGGTAVYAVTARHVIDGTQKHGHLSLVVNNKTGGAISYPVPHKSWVDSVDTDVAIALLTAGHMDRQGVDWKYLNLEMLADEEFLTDGRIGEGDDVSMVGMFQKFVGRQQIQPVLRRGMISLMPYEKIPVNLDPHDPKSSKDVDAYLVEAQSWGGNSGTPAFVATQRPIPGEPSGTVKLLGLVHGHHAINEKIQSADGAGTVPINSGIAIVIPAHKIRELLMDEMVVEERETAAAKSEPPSSS